MFNLYISRIIKYYNSIIQYVKELILTPQYEIEKRKSRYKTVKLIISIVKNYFLVLLISTKSGGYRSRTDDPLRARQML